MAARVEGDVDTSEETRRAHSKDASIFRIMPEAVVFPRHARDVQELVRFASGATKTDHPVSLTARAAGTDMSGGPLTDSVVVAFKKYMNKLVELNDGHALVEPGLMFKDFDAATAARGYLMPAYTASREWCAVGGMVSNNSGGEKNLKYGKVARYVSALWVVLADGNEYLIEPVSGEALRAQAAQDTFLGEVTRQMLQLVIKERATIEKGKPLVAKNSSGYALWDVYDATTDTLDLTKLFVGAQGTLGLITKIRFSLVRPKPYSAMAVLFLHELSHLGEIVRTVLERGPESFESYDDHTFSLAVRFFPEFAAQMKQRLIPLGISFLPEVLAVASGGVPKLVLLAEFTGDTQEEAFRAAKECADALYAAHKVMPKLAANADEARKYWVVRRESFNLLRKKVRGLTAAPFIDDFVVPPTVLSEFLPKLNAILDEYRITYTVAGHIGDGNFHIIPLMDFKSPDTPRIIDELSHRVYELVLSYRGSITGEHNDGIIRTPYVERAFGPELYALFVQVKKLFDPLSIFNPGKKVGHTFDDVQRHLDTEGVKEGLA